MLDYRGQSDHPSLYPLDTQLIQGRQHAGGPRCVGHRCRNRLVLELGLWRGHALYTVMGHLRRRQIQPSHLVLQVVQHLAGAVGAALNATVHVVMMMRRRRRTLLLLQGHG